MKVIPLHRMGKQEEIRLSFNITEVNDSNHNADREKRFIQKEELTSGAVREDVLIPSGFEGALEQTFKYLVRTPTGSETTLVTTGRGINFLVTQKGYRVIKVISKIQPGTDSV